MRDTPDATQAPEDGLQNGQTDAPPEAEDSRAAATTQTEDPLRKAELAAREHYEAWLRAKAEADNIRKRAQAEITSAHKFALENFAAELLAVKDSLEAAVGTETATVESMKAGVEITLKQLAAVFEKFNITEVNPAGQRFDPHRHQAISTQPSDAEPNTVLQVLQKGYLLHERVIRPALVTVSKAVEK